jgi:hypothetical protein
MRSSWRTTKQNKSFPFPPPFSFFLALSFLFMDFTTNYCGMYWSDGRIQASVKHGRSKPVSALDAACQIHDAEYATARSENDLFAADNKFYNTTKSLGFRGNAYGSLVKYGNYAARKTKNLLLGPFSHADSDSFVQSTSKSNMRSRPPSRPYVGSTATFDPWGYESGFVYNVPTPAPGDMGSDFNPGPRVTSKPTATGSSKPAVRPTTAQPTPSAPSLPGIGTAPSGGVIEPAVPARSGKVDEVRGGESAASITLTDPDIMVPVRRERLDRTYRPLKGQKRAQWTASALKLRLKYHPSEKALIKKSAEKEIAKAAAKEAVKLVAKTADRNDLIKVKKNNPPSNKSKKIVPHA